MAHGLRLKPVQTAATAKRILVIRPKFRKQAICAFQKLLKKCARMAFITFAQPTASKNINAMPQMTKDVRKQPMVMSVLSAKNTQFSVQQKGLISASVMYAKPANRWFSYATKISMGKILLSKNRARRYA